MGRRILVSWIGHTDLRAFAREDDSADRRAIEQVAGVRDNEGGVGPVKALIDLEQFDEVHLLSDYEPEIAKPFASGLRVNPSFIGSRQTIQAIMARCCSSCVLFLSHSR